MTHSSTLEFEFRKPLTTRHVPTKRGFEWYIEAWALFKKAPLPLMALPIILFAGNFVCSMIPPIGWLLSVLFNIFMTYGAIAMAADLDRTGAVRWNVALELFRSKFLNMFGFFLLKNALMGLAFLVIFIVGLWSVFGSFAAIGSGVSELFTMDSDALVAFLKSMLTLNFLFFSVLIATISAALVMCVQFMGDSLIALSDVNPIEAALLSLSAIGKNTGSLTLASIMGLFLLVPIALTLGLGLFVYYPLVILVTYRAFRDIFIPTGNPQAIIPL